MDTALGWWRSLSESQRAETGFDPADPAWSMIRAALASKAQLSILPAQDILRLGSEARMNYPGHDEGQLDVAARAGRAHAGARGGPARRDGRCRPALADSARRR